MSFTGFLTRHLLAAVTTIYIDVLHDADIGVSPEQSDKKLVNIPYVIKTFQRAERSDAVSSREVGPPDVLRGRQHAMTTTDSSL